MTENKIKLIDNEPVKMVCPKKNLLVPWIESLPILKKKLRMAVIMLNFFFIRNTHIIIN